MITDVAYPTLTGDGARRLLQCEDRVVVVGAGGWLGLATLEALHQLLGAAFARRVVCFGSNDRLLRLRGGVEIVQASLASLGSLPSMPSLVLHFAFLTQEKAKLMSEADYVAANRTISGQVLDALDAIGAVGVFVASSGAVYMADNVAAETSKRLYGQLKLEDESRFAAWASAGSRRAAIARIFNVAGPYMTIGGAYALAAFIGDVHASRPIEIRATRPVFRSYVAISELMSVALGLLTDADTGVTLFDTAGDRNHEMADIARAVAETLGARRGFNRSPLQSDTPDCYLGEGDTYRRLRQRYSVQTVDFSDQVAVTAQFISKASPSPRFPDGSALSGNRSSAD